MVSKSVPEASRERLGSVPERPRRDAGASRGSPRMSRDARKGALEPLGACRGDQNRHQFASGSGKIKFSPRCAFAKHCRSNFLSILVDFCVFCKVCEPLKVLHLSAKTEVQHFALRVESLTRCNLEKERKSVPKSTRNHRRSRLGAAQATFSVDFGRSKQLGRATWSDSRRLERLGEPLGATKSIEVGRSGSVGRPGRAGSPRPTCGNSNRDNSNNNNN